MASILIVDDEKDICELVNEFITDLVDSPKIVTAHDGLDAFVACTNEKFDLIITDMKMPFLNGKDFILATRTKPNENIETPVIMLSGFLNTETINRLEEKGILCLSKPINSDSFTSAIKKALSL